MSTAVDTKKNPVAEFSGFLDKFKPQLALALPKHMTADRMSRLALTAFSSNSALQKCTPKSIAASIMTAGQLGLEPGVNGAGFLIPYKETCTFVPGWKGLVDLVARSGRGTVFTGVIFKDQSYTFTDGAKRDLVIHNETDLEDPEDITHAYAIGWVKDATIPIIELWRVSKIRKHRDKYNKVGDKHYSYRDWEMYCRKVPLLQVLKYMPCSIEVSNAIAINNAAESGRAASIDGGIVIDNETGEIDGDTKAQQYPDDQFTANLPAWLKLISGGKKTADQVIAMAQSKYPLTDDQKKRIREGGIVAPKNDEIANSTVLAALRAKASEASITDAEVAEHLGVESLDGITNAQAEAAFKFISNPVGE